MLAAHDTVTTNSRKAQQKLGKLVNQCRHAAHTASLEELPETARPLGPGNPLGGIEIRTFTKARYRRLQGGRNHGMPSDGANGLTPCHTRSRVRGHGKAFHWDRGARGSEVPLPRYSCRGTPATHASAPEQGRW